MVDVTGKKYGRLTGIKPASRNAAGRILWLFKCDCGREHLADARRVRKGVISSCGCLRSEICTVRGHRSIKFAQQACVTHGLSNQRIYRIYRAMIQRCYSKTHKSYKDYGGRGITVCEEWLSDVISFVEWALSHGYNDSLSIDRKDNSKGYSPENCCFKTTAEQNRNTRQNIFITINGITKTKTEWARELGMHVSTIDRRIRRGMTLIEAIMTPILRKELII